MAELGHIGDGVYASYDGYHLWLAVNDHTNKVVALESSTFLNVMRTAGNVWDKKQLAKAYRKIANELDPENEEKEEG